MNFSSYFVLSTLVVAGIIAHAYVAHEQFYPAVVYLSTDKMCLAVMYNFAFALFLFFGKVLLRIFIGTLRDLEVEQLVDSGRGFLADTILFLVFYAPTIDNREVGTVYLIQYICCVIFMKVFHLTTQIRVSHMFEVGVPRLIVNIKLVALMGLLLGCDLVALQYFYSVASRSSTFFTWILFEALTMSTVVVVSICKYSVHMVDLRLDNGWPGKSVCLFYIDLIHDVVSMTLFLVFMLTFFVQNPSRLPIYMMADVIQVARKLAQRLRSFRRYRRISLNMELRFPDATDEEIEQNEHCVICRDSLFEGSKPKKLHCSHIFHIDCLRSWLVMQQVCPTCRAEIPADGPLAAASPAPPVPGAAAVAGAAAAAPGNGTDETPQAPQQAGVPSLAPAATAQAAAAPEAVGAAPAPVPVPAHTPTANAVGVSTSPTPAPPAAQPAGAGNAASSSFAAPVAPPSVAQAAQAAPAASVAATGFSAAANATPAMPAATASLPRATASPSAAEAAAAMQTAPFAGAPMPQAAPSFVAAAAGETYGALSSLPPVHDILESLKRAEDISKFLRQQTEFWMEQVRQIERNHSPPLGGTSAGSASLQMPILSAGGFEGTSTTSAAEASSATTAVASECKTVTGDATPSNPMAELRRLQQEQWERKRSVSGNLGSSASSGNLGSASPP